MAEFDLTKTDDVQRLMRSSRDSVQWQINCALVRGVNGGRYPAFWNDAIIQAGIVEEVLGH